MYPVRIIFAFSVALLTVPVLAQTEAGSALPLSTPPIPASALVTSDLPEYSFQPKTHKTLNGTKYTVDFFDAAGKSSTVVEIPVGTKTLSPLERAKTISTRLMDASIKDRRFWDALDSKPKNSEVVVALGKKDGDFVITADAPSAVLAGCSTKQYATLLLKQIQHALLGKLRDAKFDYELTTDEDKLERANDYRRQAEESYASDKDRTEALYLQAIRVVPTYAAAYIALSQLYIEQGKSDKATALLKTALQDQHLDLLAANAQIDPGAAADAVAMIKKL